MAKKILIVDDEQDLLDSVAVMLQSKGYDVITASDGAEALEKAKTERPNLIILDIMLPKIDGYNVCKMLKFDEKYQEIPIILFTARTQASDVSLGLGVGADAYVPKPFDPQVLLNKIVELIK